MWIKYPRNGKYHCVTPPEKVSLLGPLICGGYKPGNIAVSSWKEISDRKKQSQKNRVSICPICRDYYMAHYLLGKRASENWWQRWQEQKAVENEKIRLLSQNSSSTSASRLPSATEREQRRLQASEEAKIEAKKELRKAEVAKTSHRNNLAKEREDFAKWFKEVQSYASRNVVFPGQIVTLQEAADNDTVVVYLAEPDPLNTLQSDLYKSVLGYKTYVPRLVDGVLLVGTSSELGKAIDGKSVKDKFVVNTQAGIFYYTITSLSVEEEDNYLKNDWKQDAGVLDQSKQDVYEGCSLPDVAGVNKEIADVARDAMNWSDKYDATRYTGYLAYDATRYTGYLARDGNSFGSFPSHDDYSDESEP